MLCLWPNRKWKNSRKKCLFNIIEILKKIMFGWFTSCCFLLKYHNTCTAHFSFIRVIGYKAH